MLLHVTYMTYGCEPGHKKGSHNDLPLFRFGHHNAAGLASGVKQLGGSRCKITEWFSL